ncbi:hypothetical protein FO497_13495 [Bacillus cereus ATCC 10876]|uniref:hypothetical protein n=1 Tax=Bacillus TaxID=1386 RepID=UPI0005034859|nr:MULTISPECIES: hypothetical protein [Bacillus]MDJ0280706.1 hypothetical protein [Bacillus bombysepticus]KFL78839.1 hypothetical protein DJ50_5369 [Bacillus cereus ATCC 10876]MBG9866021.1 hypothetical protein [Bacillus cereus]MBO1128289.1 hypothetical protein [Bacillus cereus]MDJ0294673.1 hypothetical protein [Bacillus bombysepticus]
MNFKTVSQDYAVASQLYQSNKEQNAKVRILDETFNVRPIDGTGLNYMDVAHNDTIRGLMGVSKSVAMLIKMMRTIERAKAQTDQEERFLTDTFKQMEAQLKLLKHAETRLISSLEIWNEVQPYKGDY